MNMKKATKYLSFGALVLMLAGALVTHLTGISGSISLRTGEEFTISMNHFLKYGGFRFYQADYDEDLLLGGIHSYA